MIYPLVISSYHSSLLWAHTTLNVNKTQSWDNLLAYNPLERKVMPSNIVWAVQIRRAAYKLQRAYTGNIRTVTISCQQIPCLDTGKITTLSAMGQTLEDDQDLQNQFSICSYSTVCGNLNSTHNESNTIKMSVHGKYCQYLSHH